MKTTQYPVDQLEKQFESQIVLDMIEMKTILGTDVDMTIYRNLKRLCYVSSYSHAGKYYSLKRLARFDSLGLWHYSDIHFSESGTLRNTIISLLEQSEEGYLAKELQEILQVTPHNALLSLCRNNQIIREQTGNNFVYFHPGKIDAQLKHRKERVFQPVSTYAECLGLFLKGLNEKQLRLYAGLESIQAGYGGDKAVSEKLGINEKTVARGREELLTKDIDFSRIRNVGAGRPSINKTKKS
jgi:predicted Zn-ribbon and HTH transcriptional regulator